MQAKRLRNAIIKRGGTAEFSERFRGINGPSVGWELSGELNGHDVHMYLCNGGTPESGGNSYFTTRAISQRGYYDPSSDYNPTGQTFCNTIKSLDWATR